jgi:hypothetical protein
MRAVYALYETGFAAQRAVNSLRAAGVPDSRITVITPAPMEDFEFSHIGKDTWLWYIACAGGLLGFLGSTTLARFTQMDWPIVTGNMPVVAWWPNLIVMFEMTMFGAISATVLTLIISGGLLRKMPALYDPEVSDGKILVGVENPAEGSVPELERALLSAPDARLKTI